MAKEMKVIKDGNAWAFVLSDFENLQVSPSYWAGQPIDDFLDSFYEKLIEEKEGK